ncbi:MAG: hypothetical protein IH849_08835 [Acidobacteria bacterium]|nr:hypothetical protein [Acidobacteriota bacterium]
MTHRARFAVAVLIAVAVLGAVEPAMACPVCFGESDSPMAQGMNNGILLLLGVIGTVQVGFVALFVSFRRRGKAVQERKDSFEVIRGGRGGGR